MGEPQAALEKRAQQYASMRGIELEATLGFGKDGSVFSTSAGTAVKIFESGSRFENECECYQRLKDTGTRDILGHHIPRMLRVDEKLLVIEMTIVRRPFVLDFATAYLDREPDFTDDVIETWAKSKQEEFGKHWGTVQIIIQLLWDRCGIYMMDVHPANVAFQDE